MKRESKTVHDGIRRGVQGQMEASLLIWLIMLQKSRGERSVKTGSCGFDFHCASDYTMASSMFLLVLDSIRLRGCC
jgi:hypothetical protein